VKVDSLARVSEDSYDDAPEQMRVRLDKVERLRENGIDPYPVGFPRTATIGEVRAKYPDLEPDTATGEKVGITGRVMLSRVGGKLCFVLDHLGRIVDGDQLLYVMGCAKKQDSSLRGPVIGPVMSNLGLEVALREAGIEFQRAPVGDRYVLALLRETGGVLGGETSGHVLCLDKTTAGDGLVSALPLLCAEPQAFVARQ